MYTNLQKKIAVYMYIYRLGITDTCICICMQYVIKKTCICIRIRMDYIVYGMHTGSIRTVYTVICNNLYYSNYAILHYCLEDQGIG